MGSNWTSLSPFFTISPVETKILSIIPPSKAWIFISDDWVITLPCAFTLSSIYAVLINIINAIRINNILYKSKLWMAL